MGNKNNGSNNSVKLHLLCKDMLDLQSQIIHGVVLTFVGESCTRTLCGGMQERPSKLFLKNIIPRLFVV